MILIRGTSLTGFVDLVDELGGDSALLLERAGIARESVGDFGSFISFVAMLQVVEAAADATGTIGFGRRLATRQDIEVLGSVGAAARTAPTVGAAIRTFQRYLRAYTPGAVPRLEPAGDGRVRFFLQRTLPGPPYSQAAEVGLGLALRVVRLLVAPGWHPLATELAHRPLGTVEDYERHYESPCTFGQPVTGFVFAASDLDRPLSSDAETHDAMVAYLQSVTSTTQSTVPMVNDLIRRLLPGGTVELAVVADGLGLHPRTLQRRLEDEGVTFVELVQDVRRRTAENYLRDTDMSLRHLATELGYLEQSTFSRASRRWFGMSPLAYRKALRQTVG
ncbi:AraC family transcriptional regulator [Nocardioides mangrovi]|uniref:AraC family transcriptional regulator n=1 Tax=Nocardioides mangrovi TaxID=2874580 RepID=A0ABS7UGS9_9ACTN|nr:AraC family transcriptional regulator [Nocardioides mangrovi]MBZ5739828.1 AraC family transcriptional regulator [Nocardioides mangrovi]